LAFCAATACDSPYVFALAGFFVAIVICWRELGKACIELFPPDSANKLLISTPLSECVNFQSYFNPLNVFFHSKLGSNEII